MRLGTGVIVWLACALLAGACGTDSEGRPTTDPVAGAGGEGASASSGNGGEQGPTPGNACHDGCVATLAAACRNGPADQASCESACHGLETGKCGGEYATFQGCAAGKAVTCGSGALDGLPVVEACSDEQAAFIACING